MAKIYISSTFQDLIDFRKSVTHALRTTRHEVISMEEYVAAAQRPLEKCLEDVAACDIYIGLFGWRYGYIPQTDNPDRKSITELEYTHAGAKRRKRLIFLSHPEMALRPSFADHFNGENERGKRVDEFRAELQRDNTCSFFSSPDELAAQVMAAVQLTPQGAVQSHLEKVQEQFIRYMRQTIDTAPDEEVSQRYFPLRLQDIEEVRAETRTEKVTRFVSWEELIRTKPAMLLLGSAGSGKTTLLLHIAYSLAKEVQQGHESRIPIYLPLNVVDTTLDATLLDHIARTNDLDTALLRELWKSGRLCLLLGGAEKVHPQRIPGIVDAIKNLCMDEDSSKNRILITCRPNVNRFRASLDECGIAFHHAVIASLNDAEIKHFLVRHKAPQLVSMLDESLYEVMQSPDLLSALARSYRESRNARTIARSEGQLYRQLIDDCMFGNDATAYSYRYVKRPVLANLAFTIMLQDQETPSASEEQVYTLLATQLESLHQRYFRRRHVMPASWNAQELLEELIASPVLEQSRDGRVSFTKRCYRDYFAAVHAAHEDLDSPALESIINGAELEHRLPFFINLLGLVAHPEALLSMLSQRDRSLAIQLWLENRPTGSVATPTVTDSFEKQKTVLAQSPVIRLEEPVSYAILVRLLKNSDPRERLQATQALTQRGLSATDALLDAAEDEHPLVKAVAEYALIHIGECDYTKPVKRPMPPLFSVENHGISFHSHGGCNAEIGPLRLVKVPDPTTIHLALHIRDVGFDPFTVETNYNIEHTPPSLLAAQLFEAIGNMDWLCLLAHYRQIAEHSFTLAEKAEQRKPLTGLSEELLKRAARYDCFGQYLAEDLGLPWQPVVPNRPDHVIQYVEANYRKLRRLYNHTNRSRLTEASMLAKNSRVEVNQAVEENSGISWAIKTDEIKLQPETGCARDGSKLLMHMEFAQSIKNNKGGTWNGIEINRLQTTSRPLPLLLRISGTAYIETAVNSALCGLLIHELIGGGWGWTAALTINIEKLSNSTFAGVIVEKRELDSPEPEPGNLETKVPPA
jgi:Domain of unknown function (DUF4062)/NACHT domain